MISNCGESGAIRRLELPLPFQPGTINVYLVPQGDGWILVDCGMKLPSVLAAYETAGIRWPDIRQIVLTHAHPDHSGLAGWIGELTGAPVRMHRREGNVLNSLREPASWLVRQNEILRQAGVPAAQRVRIESASLRLRRHFPQQAADSHIEDGEILSTELGPMRAMLSPGHSAGHLCFYLPEAKILISGDQLLKVPTPHLEWDPEGCALDEFRASLEDISRLDAQWVLPSHWRPFRGHRTRIASVLADTYEMEAQIRRLQACGAESPWELASAFWNRPLHPFEERNAVFEMMAYLQHPD